VTLAAHNSDGRAYRSIREVLDLLIPEFPDVTISKIRFLESRGLIEPERTPSGYRKFFPTDVDRLRWILRQQSEHFLPLKVIKGRLEQGALFEAELSGTPSLFDAADHSPETTSELPAPETSATLPKAGGGGDEPPSDPALTKPGPLVEAASVDSEVRVEDVAIKGASALAEPSVAPARERVASGSRRSRSSVVFSLAELKEASGASEQLIAELLEFNLISTQPVRGAGDLRC
jgi:DNA-binding transcriptional MerR regulator